MSTLRRSVALALGLLGLEGFVGVARAADLAVGSQAPAFELMGSDGRSHSLADHVGKRGVVLAWFPKAFTPG
jgi:peroxiredoxin Q/BCP